LIPYGTARQAEIVREHRRVEVGFSWVGLPWQRSPVNTEAKYLLLSHAFEQAHCQALLRIGATREGTLRPYMSSPHKGARYRALQHDRS
jgi:N-acetyltransferase